jgi:hypothetical protein
VFQCRTFGSFDIKLDRIVSIDSDLGSAPANLAGKQERMMRARQTGASGGKRSRSNKKGRFEISLFD